MKRKLIVGSILFLCLLGGGLAFLLTRTQEPVPPWRAKERSTLRAVLQRVLAGGDRAKLDAELITVFACLRNITSAQAQFQACAFVDEDFDGAGEFGTFAELAAACPVRGGTAAINPPVLPPPWLRINNGGHIFRMSYEYQILLPGPDGEPLPGVAGQGLPAGVTDPNLAEVAWCCVARPIRQTSASQWSYLVTESGDIFGKYGRVKFEEAVRFDPDQRRSVPAGEGWLIVE